MNMQKDYNNVNLQLKQAAIALTGAELHGFLSGLACGGITDQSWQPLLYQFTNDNHAYPSQLLSQISTLYQDILQQLGDQESFNFELGFPADLDVFARADALSEWTNHFLLGIGLAQPRIDKERGDIAEALNDLQDVAQLGYEEDDNQEELEAALEEINEYVRTIALLFHTHFANQQQAHTVLH